MLGLAASPTPDSAERTPRLDSRAMSSAARETVVALSALALSANGFGLTLTGRNAHADDEDADAAWRDEIVSRLRSIQDGSAILHDGDQVGRELSRLLEED